MNKGIVVSGGSFHAGQVAVGDGAQVVASSRAEHADLARKLGELAQLIAASRLEEAHRQPLVQAIEVIRLDAPERKSTVTRAVDLLAKAAPAIEGMSALVGAVTGILAALR